MSLLDISEQKIEILLYYKIKIYENGFKKVIILEEEEALALLKDEQKKDEVILLNTSWKLLSWIEDNDMIRLSSRYMEETGMSDLDVFKYRDLKIKKCLTGWDMKDDSGNDIRYKPDYINKLPATFAYALLRKYEETIGVDEEEEKK